jgi:hypothetical protein
MQGLKESSGHNLTLHCRQQTLVYFSPPCFVVWALAIVFIITNAVLSYDFNQNGNAMTYFGKTCRYEIS